MRKLRFMSLLAIAVLAQACRKDFIVDELKGKTIIINSPKNDHVTTSNQVTFWWQELEGAEKYNLQIVQPTFLSISKIVQDTNLIGTKFTSTLQPGSYQWRIKAINNGGSTVYQTFNIKVDTTSNISNQVVYPLSPINGNLTGDAIVTFSWSALNAATYYQVQVNDGSILSVTTIGTSYSYTVPAVSNSVTSFSWRVKAFNDFSISQYNTALTFIVDLAAPSAPIPSLPIHNAIVKDTVKLVWTRTGSPDAKSDSVFVATDSLFTNVISKTRTYQQWTRINQLNNPPIVNNAIYWWRLRSIDSVGNRSVFSNQLKFKLSYP